MDSGASYNWLRCNTTHTTPIHYETLTKTKSYAIRNSLLHSVLPVDSRASYSWLRCNITHTTLTHHETLRKTKSYTIRNSLLHSALLPVNSGTSYGWLRCDTTHNTHPPRDPEKNRVVHNKTLKSSILPSFPWTSGHLTVS